MDQMKKWQTQHGVLVMSYTMFRNLAENVFEDEDELGSEMQEILFNPGPDVVICDEGHLLKNDKTSLNDILSSIRTNRKIVLTGTPLQNNLEEYFCMVNIVKPHLLGTKQEFKNRFINPIMNGQYTNSTNQDIQIMKRRSHILHDLLDATIHRADVSVLKPYLKEKKEYVIFVRLSDVQIKLYKVKNRTFDKINCIKLENVQQSY